MAFSYSDDEVNAYHAARLALLNGIENHAASNGIVSERLARAFRYLEGGPQPGSIEVKKD